jgi:hypothetical protein
MKRTDIVVGKIYLMKRTNWSSGMPCIIVDGDGYTRIEPSHGEWNYTFAASASGGRFVKARRVKDIRRAKGFTSKQIQEMQEADPEVYPVEYILPRYFYDDWPATLAQLEAEDVEKEKQRLEQEQANIAFASLRALIIGQMEWLGLSKEEIRISSWRQEYFNVKVSTVHQLLTAIVTQTGLDSDALPDSEPAPDL